MSICMVTEEAIPPVRRFCMTQRSAEYLASEFDVHLIYMKSPFEDVLSDQIHLHPIDKNWDEFDLKSRVKTQLTLTNKVVEVCRKYEVDLIYGWWMTSFLGGKIAAKPFVSDMPEFIEQMYKSFLLPLSRAMAIPLSSFQTLVARESEAVVVESEIAATVWANRKIPPNKLHSAPYGVEVEFFKLASDGNIREKFCIPDDAILVVYHGDIGFDDGVDLLIQATRKLDVWCLCVGYGPRDLMNYLKSIAGNKTIFTGWIPYKEMPKVLAAADICVSPFRSTLYTNTTFPLKTMESMAAGKATLCSRLKALSKVVKDLYDIRLVNPGDVEDIRCAISYLAKDDDLRSTLGDNAHKTAVEKFDWRIRARKEAEIFKNVINNSQ